MSSITHGRFGSPHVVYMEYHGMILSIVELEEYDVTQAMLLAGLPLHLWCMQVLHRECGAIGDGADQADA